MPESTPSVLAVLVAAGSSSRMGGVHKPLIELGDRPMLEHSCLALGSCPGIKSIVVVAHSDDLETVRTWARTRPSMSRVAAVVAGGRERAESVRIGARHELGDAVDLICVHDAARPLVTTSAVEHVLVVAAMEGAAVLALPVRDTLKHSEDGLHVDRTVERDHLWAAQTPQVFEARRFRECLRRAEEERFLPTDDAALWERYVGPVTIVRGEATNLKVTLPEDLEVARAILAARTQEVRA